MMMVSSLVEEVMMVVVVMMMMVVVVVVVGIFPPHPPWFSAPGSLQVSQVQHEAIIKVR
jgi:hypothetical protein